MMKDFAPQLRSDSILDVFVWPNATWEELFSGPDRLKKLDYAAYYDSQVPRKVDGLR